MKDTLDIRLCNCARCDTVLRGHDEPLEALNVLDQRRYPKQIYGRINSRPYCNFCFEMMDTPGTVGVIVGGAM